MEMGEQPVEIGPGMVVLWIREEGSMDVIDLDLWGLGGDVGH